MVVRLFEEPLGMRLFPRVLRSLRSLRYPGVSSGFRLRRSSCAREIEGMWV